MRPCDYCEEPVWGIGTIVLHPACEARLGVLHKRPAADRWYRIEHIRRHLKTIQQEDRRLFPRQRIINRELYQIVVRLLDELEQGMKGEQK